MSDKLLLISQKIINMFDISILIFEKHGNDILYIYGNNYFLNHHSQKINSDTDKLTFLKIFPEYDKPYIIDIIENIVNTSKTISFIEENIKLDIYSIDQNYIVFCMTPDYSKEMIDSTKTKILLNNMNHAIRTPLNSITGMAMILLESELTEEQYEYIQNIQKSCLVLVNVITDLLDFLKLETKNLTLSLNLFNMEDCINSCINVVQNKISMKHLDLHTIIHPNIHKYVIGDMPRIKQIILNLLDNAIKFTDTGYIKIEVSQDPILTIKISDSGIGMTESEQLHLFSLLDSIPTFNNQPIGLGLPITKYLVELMKGTITVESKINSGSIFTITLPLQYYDFMDNTNNKTYNVLLLNSNFRERTHITRILFKEHIETTVASSIDEALLCMEDIKFNIIVIDHESYIEPLIQKIKDINIILLDKYTKQNKPKNVQVLNKPYNLEDLKNLIIETLHISKFNYDLSILNVEDVEINRIINEKMLEAMGFKNYKSLSSGIDAYNDLLVNDYDIVLLDIKLPHKNGLEIVDDLVAQNIKLPYIIVMTAYVTDQLNTECNIRNVNDIIYKPIDMTKLQVALKKAQRYINEQS